MLLIAYCMLHELIFMVARRESMLDAGCGVVLRAIVCLGAEGENVMAAIPIQWVLGAPRHE